MPFSASEKSLFAEESQKLYEEVYEVLRKYPFTTHQVLASLSALAAVAGQVIGHVDRRDMQRTIGAFISTMMQNVEGIESYGLEVTDNSDHEPKKPETIN